MMALQNLGVDTRHDFACDTDAHAKQTIPANHKPEVFFDDIVLTVIPEPATLGLLGISGAFMFVTRRMRRK